MVTVEEFKMLPLSGTLEVALSDLTKVRRSKKYKPQFYSWHSAVTVTKTGTTTCHVCLAGSVMAKTFNCPINKTRFPHHLGEMHGDRVRRALVALNYYRMGNLKAAIKELHPEISLAHIPKTRMYKKTPKVWTAFYRDTRKIIKWLKSVGI